MTREELDKLSNPWIRIDVKPNTNPYFHGRTEMFLIDHSSNYHGCVANRGKDSHYDLGFLSIDLENRYTIIINRYYSLILYKCKYDKRRSEKYGSNNASICRWQNYSISWY